MAELRPLATAQAEAGTRQVIRRLVRLGADDVDLGRCEHGIVARTWAQVGRARKKFEVHGAANQHEALEALAEAITIERRGPRGRR